MLKSKTPPTPTIDDRLDAVEAEIDALLSARLDQLMASDTYRGNISREAVEVMMRAKAQGSPRKLLQVIRGDEF
jgi:hypothetical protein